MRISRKKHTIKPTQHFRLNEAIKALQLRVVDDEGKFLGIMSSVDALKLARENDMDLVEIVPKGEIHVAKITDYGRFKYQKEKESKKQKAQQKKVDVKGIRLSLRIGKHDIDLRVRQAIKFLKERDKVKIELVLKGREKAKSELGREVINNFIDEVSKEVSIKIEQPMSRQGGKLFVIIAP